MCVGGAIERVRRAGGERAPACGATKHIDFAQMLALSARRSQDVMGYPRPWHEHPRNYWTYARHFRPSGPTCSRPTRRGACPVHLYMVSGWSARPAKPSFGIPDELPRAGAGAGVARRVSPRNTDGGAGTELRLDRSSRFSSTRTNVSLALLPSSRACSPTCDKRRDVLQGGYHRMRRRPGSGNPLAPYFETVAQGPGKRENIAPFQRVHGRGSHGEPCPRSPWLAPAQAVSDHPPAKHPPRSGVRHRRHQRRIMRQQGLELDRDLPSPGNELGRVLRPTLKQAPKVRMSQGANGVLLRCLRS